MFFFRNLTQSPDCGNKDDGLPWLHQRHVMLTVMHGRRGRGAVTVSEGLLQLNLRETTLAIPRYLMFIHNGRIWAGRVPIVRMHGHT